MSASEPGGATVADQRRVSLGRRLPLWVRSVNYLSTALMVPAALVALLMMGQIIIDVTSRTFFNTPVSGTFEMTSYWWMVTLVFLGFGFAQLRREHIRATIVPELLPETWQRGVEILAVALLALFAVAMAYYGFEAALQSFETREAAPGKASLSIWPFAFMVPIGSTSLALQCVATIYEIANDIEREEHSSAEDVI